MRMLRSFYLPNETCAPGGRLIKTHEVQGTQKLQKFLKLTRSLRPLPNIIVAETTAGKIEETFPLPRLAAKHAGALGMQLS